MKIKAKNNKIASMKLCVPIDGVISIDHEGVAEVSTKCATLLVKGTNDWDYLKKNSIESAVVTEVKDEVEEKDDINEREKFETYLDGLSFVQMKDYAKEAKLPETEYNSLTSRKLMKAYLLKKYDDTTAAE